MTTHYLPYFTRRRLAEAAEPSGVCYQAVCGQWIPLSAHSNEPACSACLEYLEAPFTTPLDCGEQHGKWRTR